MGEERQGEMRRSVEEVSGPKRGKQKDEGNGKAAVHRGRQGERGNGVNGLDKIYWGTDVCKGDDRRRRRREFSREWRMWRKGEGRKERRKNDRGREEEKFRNIYCTCFTCNFTEAHTLFQTLFKVAGNRP